MQLKIKRLHPDAHIPKYHTAGAACFDLHAVLESCNDCLGIGPGAAVTIDTGLAFEVPDGFVLMLYSRSGHGFKNRVRMSNCVGVVDSDYRGELRVKLHNDGEENFHVVTGDRIAQAMLIPVPNLELIEVEELSSTVRGSGGYGSTGA